MNRKSESGAGGVARLVAEERDGIRRLQEPVAAGVPFAAGIVRDDAALRLVDADGGEHALQTQVTDRWSDGSVRWALLDFRVDLGARERNEWSVRLADTPRARPASVVQVQDTSSGLYVDTGVARFAMGPGDVFPFTSVQAGGVELLAGNGARCLGVAGEVWNATIDRAESEVAGPLRATVQLHGHFRGDAGRCPLRFLARLHFYSGSASARLELTIHNPDRAQHPGGHWELGDPGSFVMRDLSLEWKLRQGTLTSWSADPSAPLADAGTPDFELYQDSSGGENWQSPVHRTADGTVAPRFRGYRVRVQDVERTGLRATPRVAVHDGSSGISVTPRHFWQNFPKALEAGSGRVIFRLFPEQCATPHELQGGERKTHEVTVTFGAEALRESVDTFRSPLVAHAHPDTFVNSRALPYLTAEADDPHALYRQLVRQAVEGADTFEHKRERLDEWGWRNFGDLYADHEAVEATGPETFVSHHNNQYDVIYAALQQFARSGDLRWYSIMEELGQHVADIDIYHTTEDKNAYSGGLFWHTAHYVDAGLSTHRSYPKGASCGGGPDNEHNYTGGLMHRYFLTGNPRYREAALSGAEWAIRAEDGSGTPFRWLDAGPTGLSTKTRHFDFHGPGRGAGNSIQTLLDAWRLTGEARFLDQCERVIRRTIHPNDDVEALGLLDAENRWSYTVYLQALGRYLDTMAEADRIDDTYAYARASLLTYARWMAEHERITLDHPEGLEHPTETWAAQDLRKSDVFLFAALHSQGEERARFLERSQWFHDKSLARLDTFATKSTLRPVVLLMRYGLMAAWFHHHPDEARPPGPDGVDFGRPTVFVPQKLRAISKARRIAAVGAAVALGVVVASLARMFL